LISLVIAFAALAVALVALVTLVVALITLVILSALAIRIGLAGLVSRIALSSPV